MNDCPSKLELAGYERRPDGTFAKKNEFDAPSRTIAIETIVRSAAGALLRVESSKRAVMMRKERM